VHEPVSLAWLPLRQRAPFAGLFVAASLGVLASDQQPEWWPVLSVAFLLSVLLLWKIRSTLPACILMFFVFAFWHGNQVTTDPGYQRSRQIPFDGSEHTVTLTVLSEPKLDQLRSSQRFVALVCCIDHRFDRFQVSAECAGEPFSYGDQIIAQGRFSVPTHPMNPGEFDFGRYLQRQNIYLNFRTHRDVPAMVIARNQANPFVSFALFARHRILEALQAGLEDDVEVAQTIQGMILGARAETNSVLKRLFQETGTIHLFSASGLQVGLLTGVAWNCLRYLRLPRQTFALAIASLAVVYCALTGFYPATIRATVMAVFMSVGLSLERPAAMINSLCGSGLLILLHDTQALFQTGFQLSFVAVIAILTAVRPFGHLLYRPFQVDPFLPTRLLRPWQQAWHRATLRGCEIFSLSTVCWGATAPVLILQEHQLSLVAVFANLLVVPLATSVMLLGLGGLLAGTISKSFAVCLNNSGWLITKLILGILHTATAVPGHSVNISPLAWGQSDRITVLAEGSEQVLHLHLKDRDWLINTGKLSQWQRLTEPYLRSQGVNRLDELIVCEAPPREANVLNQMNHEFQVNGIVQFRPRPPEDQTPRFRGEQSNPSADTVGNMGPVEIFRSNQPGGGETSAPASAVSAILVHLEQFRILILPNVTERSLTALNCDHVDVVYCGRLRSRRFPRQLMLAKLTPSVLVLNGTKPEVIANSEGSPTNPKCFYLKQDGAITTALQNNNLVIQAYRGTEFRLPSRSR
jgi:ComEC/Rec2-related protein